MLPPPDPCHATIVQVTKAPCPHGVTWQCGRVPFVVHLLRLDLATTYCGADPDAPGAYCVPPGMAGLTCGGCKSAIGSDTHFGRAPTKEEVDDALARWRMLHPELPGEVAAAKDPFCVACQAASGWPMLAASAESRYRHRLRVSAPPGGRAGEGSPSRP
jgi:hypothetical protein